MTRNKGFIAQLIVAVSLSIIFIGLGDWQLNRAHDSKAAKQVIPDSPRVDLESIASVTSNLEPSAINRLVKFSGNYRQIFIAPKQELLSDRKKSTANLEVRVLELSGNRGILVVRGVQSLEDQEIIGKVKIAGRLYPRQTSDSTKALRGELSRIDPALVVGETDLSLFDGYVVATSEETRLGQEILTTRIPAPQLKSKIPGNYWQHISYVFIWWLMAVLVLFAPFYNSMKERQIVSKVAVKFKHESTESTSGSS
ncbi:MAG: SURF1 family cytochrome oxidase biogenesis protein [Actinomycetes bacterium]